MEAIHLAQSLRFQRLPLSLGGSLFESSLGVGLRGLVCAAFDCLDQAWAGARSFQGRLSRGIAGLGQMSHGELTLHGLARIT